MAGIVELSQPPRLAALYRRALLKRGSGESVPELTLSLRGVGVDRAHLAEYDQVCGFRLSDTLPVTYPHVLAFPLAMRLMTEDGFPFPVIGLVHIANRITQTRPLHADEVLDVTVHAEHLRPHDRGRQVDLVAVATVDGVEVWRGVSTYLRREGGGTGRDGGDSGSGRDGGDGGKRPAPPAPSAVWRVPASVGVDYAGVSGDRNPIHTSRIGARLFGFRRPIAHGMWTMARCLAALEGRLPDAYTVDVTFKRPVLLPATVAFSASPSWTFALHSAKSGQPHLTGTLTASAPPGR